MEREEKTIGEIYIWNRNDSNCSLRIETKTKLQIMKKFYAQQIGNSQTQLSNMQGLEKGRNRRREGEREREGRKGVKMKRGREGGRQARKQAGTGDVIIIIHSFLFSNRYPFTMYYLQIDFFKLYLYY